MRGTIFLFSLFILVGSTTWAKQFKNAYITFEIPERWNCNLEATEWVCRSSDANESKEAIIVLTAKEKGTQDRFDIYEDHLKKPIGNTTKTGETLMSQVTGPAVQKKINDQTWIEGFHLGSEIQNYYTRYIATIKGDIAVLVTFSVHRDFYNKYMNDFLNAIKSLNVIATKNNFMDASVKASDVPFGRIDGGKVSEGIDIPGLEPSQPKQKNKNFFLIIGAVIVAAIAALILLKRKK